MSHDAVRDMYLNWTAGGVNGEPQDPEAWGELTAEPRAVDYVETDVSGLPAMWAIPHRFAASWPTPKPRTA
jgi:epsilon-lactone hydrolase